MNDPMFDQQLAEAADLGLEIIDSSKDPFPGFWFSLIVVVPALGLAVPSALGIIGLTLRLTPAGYVPLGRAHSGGEESLMESSICRLPLLRWENIPEDPSRVSRLVRLMLLPRSISLSMLDRSLDRSRCDCSVANGAAVSDSVCALTILIAVS